MLSDRGFALRAGLHCAPLAHESAGTVDTGTVRVSFGWHSTAGELNAKNAFELLAQPDIDGGLIGGASLKPVDFSEIVKATDQD